MNSNVRLKLTKILVVGSIILSLGTMITLKLGIGEIYPFFFWKLYSQPLGWENKIDEYRIYAKSSLESPYQRLQAKATYNFTIDEYDYTFNRNVIDYLNDNNSTSFKRLKIFIDHVEPGYKYYKIVKESYSPRNLNTNVLPYDTATVISF